MGGGGCGCTPLGHSAWLPLQLAIKKPWSAPGGPFVSAWRLLQLAVEKPWPAPG